MKKTVTFQILSLNIAILICLTSWQGLISPEIYVKETANWAMQAMGQDLINICIIPFYLLSAFFITREKTYSPLIWVGITFYFIYTFLIYCFDIRFNRLFLLYTLILGLTIYSLVFLLYAYRNKFKVTKSNSLLSQLTGGYFIFIAVLFYGVWFSEILLANFLNTTPKNLEQLPTNPVHVLDMCIVLPGIFISGILLIQKKELGYFLAPVILTFSLMMELTIGILLIIFSKHGQESHIGFIWFMFGLAFISLFLLFYNLKNRNFAFRKCPEIYRFY
jgi:hypothetical protein